MGKYSCEACKKKCKKEAIRLQDKYFHVACFMCKECKKPLATDGFYTKDGAHYCGADYQRLFGTKCHACGKIVEGEVMTVLGKTYHQDCFRCSKCLKKFQPGEKATFANNDEHWCHSCQLQHQQQQQEREQQQQQQLQLTSPVPTELVPGFSEAGATSATAVEIPTSPQSINDENEKPQTPRLEVEPTKPNGFQKPESPVEQKKSSEVAEIPKEDNGAKIQKPASNLPRVFGMPNNKFYNISYLERSNADFKRGPSANAVAKEPPMTHYHRPDNFSYTNLRKDFKSETGIHGDKREMVLMSKRPGAQGKPLAPIERDDWPGPPEPAAAYPELLRDKTPQQPKSPHADDVKQLEEEKKVTKEIDELSKMTDSGAAAVILRDLKKKRAESPTLDPRNASMTPSGALETHHKLRYEQPFFASPSRNLDMRQRVLQQERNRKSMNDLLFAPCNFGGVVKPGHGLSVYRPGSSFDTRNGYQSDGTEIEPRPKSSAGILNSYSFDVYDDRSYGDVDPTTGLRHSSHLRSTLPHGLSGRFLLENINLSSPGSKDSESPKVYPYELLAQKNLENLIGVNKDSLEHHLSKDEFETVFQMNRVEFYRLPVWQRNEAKLRVGLM